MQFEAHRRQLEQASDNVAMSKKATAAVLEKIAKVGTAINNAKRDSEREPFIPAPKSSGERLGYTFQDGPLGSGYYRDVEALSKDMEKVC